MPNNEIIEKNIRTIISCTDPKHSKDVIEALRSLLSEFEGDYQMILKNVKLAINELKQKDNS